MSRVFFYSDPHFGHANIIHYCKRPFKSCEEMDEVLIKNYNYIIQDDDIVYFLGDAGFDKYNYLKRIFLQLKGHKILIRGNHDKASHSFYRSLGFFDVLDTVQISLGKTQVNLRHYPNRSFFEILDIARLYFFKKTRGNRSLKARWKRFLGEFKRYSVNKVNEDHWTLCGHVHEKWKIRNKNINCGVDVWNFKPVNVNQILAIIQKEEK